MDNQELIMSLEPTINRISDGINAIGVMTMGLSMARDPYANGFNAIWNYLVDAEQDLQEQLARIVK